MDVRPPPLQPRKFAIGSFARAPNFPAMGFRSFDEFTAWRQGNQDWLDARYAYEVSLATREPTLSQSGTCAPCLRPASFLSSTQAGERVPDGRRMPYWPHQMRCDCADRLSGRQRAIVHLAQATGLAAWTSLLLFGTPNAADRRLAGLVGSTTARPRLIVAPTPWDEEHFHLDVPDASVHIAISQDYLEFIPPLPAALTAIVQALAPGGRFIFSTQFLANEPATSFIPPDSYAFAPQTPVEYREESHRFGWDLLGMLRDAGFSDAAAYLTWSEELGYLGSLNFLFRATK
jgi:SAM-dependent methyltransferase